MRSHQRCFVGTAHACEGPHKGRGHFEGTLLGRSGVPTSTHQHLLPFHPTLVAVEFEDAWKPFGIVRMHKLQRARSKLLPFFLGQGLQACPKAINAPFGYAASIIEKEGVVVGSISGLHSEAI